MDTVRSGRTGPRQTRREEAAMAVEGTSHTWRDRPAAVGVRRPALARAMRLVLWLLAVSVLAQATFAGLFLDRHDAWRDWHAANGMVLLPLLALVGWVLVASALLTVVFAPLTMHRYRNQR
jgi:heme/copper-type cytochrome/quinol oxidase subunit 3